MVAADDVNMEVEYRPTMGADGDGEAGPTKVEIHSPSNQHYKSLTPSQTASAEKVGKSLILFERAAKSWWDPKFDSDILEDQYQESSFTQHRKQFRCALFYIIFLCAVWAVFFGLMGHPNWMVFVAGSTALLLATLIILIFTLTRFYQTLVTPTSVLLVLLLSGCCLLIFLYDDPAMSAVGTFTGTVEILLLIYTFIPLQLYMCVILGVLYSIVYEILSAVLVTNLDVHYTIGRMLLHFALHVMGVHIFIMAQVRSRSTFLKVSQSIMLRKDLEKEKQLKKKMIHSLMPPKVAEEVMKGSATTKLGGTLKFRSFHMSQMDSVTILFADIVGFTKMSSNKTAEHLVSLLNDLFGRFDVICAECGCEKISTLGDCYYSVSGCPEPRQDHARCSVEMGLSMCTAIQEFDRDHNEAVNMRVGVHTGTVLCGIVGTRRFKFDVWSHDVTLANTMESDGKPGMVHISNGTYKFIEDEYEVEPGNDVEGNDSDTGLCRGCGINSEPAQNF
ncbi:hypothetical protein NP493_415g03014 [Ridgeia piscesae]|uniref:adenylate cyclase n=1 Tax=Ridgeia piscesae TaxID=27915 RepID=A0AAD9L1H9_RIDPI|nr:hypothetical protein NP493_415g03014 [Ridgeia piscesae]